MVRGEDPPPGAQVGLKSTLASQGYFLACQARPDEDLRLLDVTPLAPLTTRLLAHDMIGEGICRLRLTPEAPFSYCPGQFVQVRHPEGALRSYSLASSLSEDFLELHVRRIEGGLVSRWLHEGVKPCDTIEIRGPSGACFYVPGSEEQPLLLAGSGTGMAPLWGIVRDAVERGHRGPIHVVQGALRADRLYLMDELDQLAARIPGVSVHACVLAEGGGFPVEPVDRFAANLAAGLENPRAFLCGDPGLVRQMQRSLFLQGVASANILADPFVVVPASTAVSPL